jgi:hypothetical protein
VSMVRPNGSGRRISSPKGTFFQVRNMSSQ